MNDFKRQAELFFLKALLVIALIVFIAGIVSPMMTITQLIFIENKFSIVSGLNDLLQKKHYFLLIMITLLSLILPAAKIALLAWILHGKGKSQQLKRLLSLMHDYGRWAMLDVLIVAILLVSIKLGAVASVTIHVGLYLFAISVLITMWVTHRTDALLNPK
jgi:paraquat-inducible protein A